MPSTYTTNLGIEKIATGEQSGTWGTTTNTNLDLVDEAVNGIVTVTLAGAGSSGSPNTLAITNGASSDGRNKYIEFNDGGDLGGTAYVQLTPNDAEKIVHIRNSLSASRSILIFQGTYNASNDFEIPNGADVVLKFNGAGAGAVVSDVFNNLRATKIDPVTLAINGTDVTSTAAELNILDGVTASTAELNYNDITTLGTSEASKVVTADANGDITIAGASYNVLWDKSSNTLKFDDDAKLMFGAGNDLRIYHDGSNSYIDETGVGSLLIRAQNLFLDNDDGSKRYIECANAAAVRLYYNGNLKIATTANGVDITGRAEGTVTTDNDGGFNLNSSNYFICTPTGALDLTFTNETAGVSGTILLVNTTPQTITVGPDVFLSDADLTAINAAGTYLLGFYCPDGTNVYMSATPALTEGS